MILLNQIKDVTDKDKVITIGNFDGIHKGHQALINKTIEIAKINKLESLVLTFDMLPEEIFKKSSFRRLYNNKLKEMYLRDLGIDVFLKIDFNDIRELSYVTFCEDILISKLKTKHIVIGENFKFGKDRIGDVEKLKEYSSNFTIHSPSLIKINNENISSSKIRKLILDGNFIKAKSYLGRDYMISGSVVTGNQLGRKLNYPTANIKLEYDYPLEGVFISSTKVDNKVYPSLASIGNKPTYNGEEKLLEVYLFDFSMDIYGKNIDVVFFEKIRDQVRFTSEDDLIKQMNEDYKYAIINIKKYGL